MNCRWVGCDRCKVYVDAGYRWAYWVLEEPGVVQLGATINLPALLACEEFWNPGDDEESAWLTREVLPTLKQFLHNHSDHGLRYFESDMMFQPESRFADWTEIERTS